MYDTAYSKNGLKNLKFVSKDGYFEAVYNENGILLKEYNDKVNMGTFNYADPNSNGIMHVFVDVLPYDAIVSMTDINGTTNLIGRGWGNSGETLKGNASGNFKELEA